MCDPSADLLLNVRIGFLQQGSSLAKWCAENKVSRQWATVVLSGQRNGPAAKKLRERLIRAALWRESTAYAM